MGGQTFFGDALPFGAAALYLAHKGGCLYHHRHVAPCIARHWRGRLPLRVVPCLTLFAVVVHQCLWNAWRCPTHACIPETVGPISRSVHVR